MKFKKTQLLSVVLLSGAVALMSGCSSTIKKEEPPKEQIDSALTMDLLWTVRQSAMPNGDTRGLAIAHDQQQLVVANSQGYVSKLSKNPQSRWTDQVVWEVRFDEAITSGPTLDSDNDRILIGTAKGRLKAIDADNGGVLWQKQLSSEVVGKPTLNGNFIFTRTVDGKVYALNRDSGDTVWVSEHQMPSLSLRGSPQVLPTDELVFVAWETGMIQALSASSGELIWETRIAIPSGRTDLERMVDIQANLQYKDGVLYALGFHGKLAAINPENGNFIFVTELSGYRDFVVDANALYVVDDDDVLYAFDAKSGAPLWKQESMKGRTIGDLAFYKEDVLLTDEWGYVHWVSKLQGTESSRFKHSNDYGDGNKIVRVEVDGDSIYLFDGQGSISRYQVRPSDRAEFVKEYGDSWF
ncbi:outer membrane protein assembly factor BamB [Thiomicrorhabdus xiamenensis]|uniref:Outer membrane protein assembly factor BamB n=1 Tax=Thiomicrorhabdus xiamenensis TaxID=2739063 RepID=A0A7D4NQ00_9GAMM|nr:outer membrane protein assembly factor BamB [Thiomicrorhabdus xiamenensis]QKI88771.1 outer membrane protein assembly factor BamB [Thiomicrorhabdus xiamenensis]